MDVLKWVGIVLVSIVMGMVCGGFALFAEPSVSTAIRVALEIVGTAVVLYQMVGIKHIADTIETSHGKQFD
jgi:spore maturation protein SpmA